MDLELPIPIIKLISQFTFKKIKCSCTIPREIVRNRIFYNISKNTTSNNKIEFNLCSYCFHLNFSKIDHQICQYKKTWRHSLRYNKIKNFSSNILYENNNYTYKRINYLRPYQIKKILMKL